MAGAIRTAINSGGRSLIHHVTTAPTSTSAIPTVEGGLHSKHTSPTDTLLSAFLILSHHNVPINALIDTGCIQTNVVSERVANLIRQDSGKFRPANVVLTSSVGGMSYPVQGFISMTVAIPQYPEFAITCSYRTQKKRTVYWNARTKRSTDISETFWLIRTAYTNDHRCCV